MTTEKKLEATSAQIIPFPGRNQQLRAFPSQQAVGPSKPAGPKQPVTVHGSSWYHEVAVLEAEPKPKR